MGGEIVCLARCPDCHGCFQARIGANASIALCSRPKTLSDVTAQDHTITVLQRTLQASNVLRHPSPPKPRSSTTDV